MKSFQKLYEELEEITGEDGSTQVARFKTDIVETNGAVLSKHPWPFLETTKTATTVASTAYVAVPQSLGRISNVTTTVGTTQYNPKPVESQRFWDYLQSLRVATSSNITQFVYRQGNKLYLWPTPQSAFTVTMRGRKTQVALSLNDYSTGTIVSIANGATTVTGSGTSWASGSVGNHIRIAYTAGDYRWYEISSITSTTVLELAVPYEGTSIAAGSATYSIGEFSFIPEDFQNLLIYRPLALYYTKLENEAMANKYWQLYDGGKEAGLAAPERVEGGLMGEMFNRYGGSFEGAYLDEEQPRDPSTADLLIKNFGYTGEGW
jgi:hypothetical protein